MHLFSKIFWKMWSTIVKQVTIIRGRREIQQTEGGVQHRSHDSKSGTQSKGIQAGQVCTRYREQQSRLEQCDSGYIHFASVMAKGLTILPSIKKQIDMLSGLGVYIHLTQLKHMLTKLPFPSFVPCFLEQLRIRHLNCILLFLNTEQLTPRDLLTEGSPPGPFHRPTR